MPTHNDTIRPYVTLDDAIQQDFPVMHVSHKALDFLRKFIEKHHTSACEFNLRTVPEGLLINIVHVPCNQYNIGTAPQMAIHTVLQLESSALDKWHLVIYGAFNVFITIDHWLSIMSSFGTIPSGKSMVTFVWSMPDYIQVSVENLKGTTEIHNFVEYIDYDNINNPTIKHINNKQYMSQMFDTLCDDPWSDMLDYIVEAQLEDLATPYFFSFHMGNNGTYETIKLRCTERAFYIHHNMQFTPDTLCSSMRVRAHKCKDPLCVDIKAMYLFRYFDSVRTLFQYNGTIRIGISTQENYMYVQINVPPALDKQGNVASPNIHSFMAIGLESVKVI